MKILPIRRELFELLRKRQLKKKFEKQKLLFERNPFHRSLKTELLEPKEMRVWSFRIDRKYRAIFITTSGLGNENFCFHFQDATA